MLFVSISVFGYEYLIFLMITRPYYLYNRVLIFCLKGPSFVFLIELKPTRYYINSKLRESSHTSHHKKTKQTELDPNIWVATDSGKCSPIRDAKLVRPGWGMISFGSVTVLFICLTDQSGYRLRFRYIRTGSESFINESIHSSGQFDLEPFIIFFFFLNYLNEYIFLIFILIWKDPIIDF